MLERRPPRLIDRFDVRRRIEAQRGDERPRAPIENRSDRRSRTERTRRPPRAQGGGASIRRVAPCKKLRLEKGRGHEMAVESRQHDHGSATSIKAGGRLDTAVVRSTRAMRFAISRFI